MNKRFFLLAVMLCAAGVAAVQSTPGCCATAEKAKGPPAAGEPVIVTRSSAPVWMAIASGGMWYAENTQATGDTLFIAYSGYTADEPGAKNWALALAAKQGWRHIVAVSGPANVLYKDREKLEANKKLLGVIIPELKPGRIIIAAHSSGTFVAHEFMDLLIQGKKSALLATVSYYDIDGSSCDACMKLAKAQPASADEGFVYRCISVVQPDGPSAANNSTMKACGADFYRELSAKNTHCSGKWCMHGWLVNQRAAEFGPVSPPAVKYYADPQIIPCDEFIGK